jgi:nitroimidazol reductase NimA-like FMN-containing flavoprotein (pyridoxamine 5'-phosphate oxidase superfamily)
MVRPLSGEEIAGLLARDVVARVATIDESGYPHVTPLWFLWADGPFISPAVPGGLISPAFRPIRGLGCSLPPI